MRNLEKPWRKGLEQKEEMRIAGGKIMAELLSSNPQLPFIGIIQDYLNSGIMPEGDFVDLLRILVDEELADEEIDAVLKNLQYITDMEHCAYKIMLRSSRTKNAILYILRIGVSDTIGFVNDCLKSREQKKEALDYLKASSYERKTMIAFLRELDDELVETLEELCPQNGENTKLMIDYIESELSKVGD